MNFLSALGFQLSSSQIVNHLLLAPHPCEQAVWDIQLLQSAPGGLELLEQRVEEARKALTWRGKILNTLGTYRVRRAHRFELARTTDPETGQIGYVDASLADTGELCLDKDAWEQWYDHVLDTVARARNFEYTVRREEVEHQDYSAPHIPGFLRLCASLTDADMEFFRDRTPYRSYAEIDWPRVEI